MKHLKIVTIFLLLTMSITQTMGQTVTLSGEIQSVRLLSNDTIYILEGFVYVEDGGFLQIEPGTIIKGDKDTKGTLIVTRDGILLAQGTAAQPIIFTSNEPEGSRAAGDWGGIIVLGNAPINTTDVNATDAGNQAIIEGGIDTPENDGQYGGTDPNDTRGGMQYCRIEYPGIAFLPGNEINGITLGGVGDGTILDHIQVSYSGDDAFEFFGGTVNAKNLVAFSTLDDDFDTDFGFSGQVQFAFALRNPDIADVSGTNSFESDNDGSGTAATPKTAGVFSNVTIIGPIENAGDVINVNYKRGAQLRRNTELNIHNSIIIGYPSGLMVDGSACETNADNDLLEVKNTILAGHTNNFELAAGSVWDIATWFNDAAYENATYTLATDVLLNDPFNSINPDARPAAGSPALGAASFDDEVFDTGFFTEVTYSGAFDGNINWASCWTNWDPQNTDYSAPSTGVISATEANFTYAGELGGFTVNFSNASESADEYLWNFGDAIAAPNDTSSLINPSWTYTNAGSYEVTLVAIGCTVDTIVQNILVDSVVGIESIFENNIIALYPNPAQNLTTIIFGAKYATSANILIFDVAGKLIQSSASVSIMKGTNEIEINLTSLSRGVYYVQLQTEYENKVLKLMVNQ